MVWAPTKRGFKSKSSGTRLFSILLKSKSKTVRKEVNSWSCLIDCSFKIFYLINRLPILPKQWNQYFQFVPPLAVCLQTDTKHLRTTIKFEVQYWLQKTKRNSMLSFFIICKNKTVRNAVQCSAEYLKLLVSQTGVDVTSRMKQNHFSGGNWKHCDCSGFFDCLVNECDDAEKLIQQSRNMPLMYSKRVSVFFRQLFKVCCGFNQNLRLKVAVFCVLGEKERCHMLWKEFRVFTSLTAVCLCEVVWGQ